MTIHFLSLEAFDMRAKTLLEPVLGLQKIKKLNKNERISGVLINGDMSRLKISALAHAVFLDAGAPLLSNVSWTILVTGVILMALIAAGIQEVNPIVNCLATDTRTWETQLTMHAVPVAVDVRTN